MTKKKIKKIPVDLKYELYEDSVQCHESDIDFINKQYKKYMKRAPLSFREDFGGTAAMACDWVKQSKKHNAWAIDLDPEPIRYGKENHYTRLDKDESKRMEYIKGNVLKDYDFKSDVICAFNFSYFIFKQRKDLLKYFKQVRKGLKKDGMFFLDIFGGSECRQDMVEETEHKNHSYFWDCDDYNPITEEVLYYIHFKTHKDNIKYERVFTYDWRMWNIKEITELLEEAGFSRSMVFWEEDGDDGEGNGEYYVTKREENCESWVSYIAALK